MSTRFRTSVGLICAMPLVACGGDVADRPETLDELFPEERRVSLEEEVDDPLTEITSLAPRSDGGFVIVDGPVSRVREYDASGRIERVLGRSGDGPGELQSPTAATYGPSGEIHVVERGSPRHTVFWPEDSASVAELAGHYGFWIDRVDPGFVVGLGTPNERFGILSRDGEVIARFGHRDPRIEEMPFWVFFVRERATVTADRVFINSSFEPTIRAFSTAGDSLFSFGASPPDWVDPTSPDLVTISSPDDRARLEEWSRGFTVVTGLAGVDDVLVVQYGRHDPQPGESDHLVRQTADIYSVDGEKLVEGVELDQRVLAGGQRLYLLQAEPPDPWTISVRTFAEFDP